MAERYHVLAPLAQGGMGELAEAEDVQLGRRVVLKVLRTAGGEEDRRRFLREASLTASVVHPNVVRILDLVFREDDAVLVLERLEGPTLREVLDHRGGLDLHEAFLRLDELLGALAACHANHVVHRDVKPENLLVAKSSDDRDRNERLVLIDFGLGKPLREHTPISAEGLILGTPGYLAPEQLLAREVDARTDIHAFGVTAFEVLTGQRLYECDGTHATMIAVLTVEPPRPSSIRPALPARVDGILAHALAKQPSDRWADVTALRRAWRAAFAELVH